MLRKIISNPLLYFNYFIRIIFTLIIYPFRFFIYNKIYYLSYVSSRSSIRNHKNISLGNKCQINSFVVLWPTKLIIGDNTQVNPGTSIYGNVFIGGNVMIAPNCMIAGGNHNFTDLKIPMIFQGSNEKGIIIEDDVWIGANSVIVDGVRIGKGSIIAAGSVVVKNVHEYTVVAGVPAIKIKTRV